MRHPPHDASDAEAPESALVPVEPAGVIVPAPRDARRPAKKPRWHLRIPTPSRRDEKDGFLAACRMREARAAYAKAKVVQQACDDVNERLEKHGRLGLLAQVKDGKIVLVGPARKSYAFIIDVACSSLKGRNATASMFNVDGRTVGRYQELTAGCLQKSDEMFLTLMRDSFRTSPPVSFVGSLSADCTKEALQLPILGLDGLNLHSLGRSSWNVLVSMVTFCWRYRASPGARFVDFVRPNVPLISTESGQCFWKGCYDVGQVRAWAQTELMAVRLAVYAMLHFDLDGHPSNAIMAAERRQELINACAAGVEGEESKIPWVSITHCQNHCIGLIESQMIRAVSPELHEWLFYAGLFWGMNGNFLRMVQAVGEMVEKYLPRPVDGDVAPIHANAVGREVADLVIKQYKPQWDHEIQEDDIGPVWSSDEEEEE